MSALGYLKWPQCEAVVVTAEPLVRAESFPASFSSSSLESLIFVLCVRYFLC